ncbi:hypothetical protein QYF61_009619, partial [Mycteria americana]
MVGLNDLKGLFQPIRFYDSVILAMADPWLGLEYLKNISCSHRPGQKLPLSICVAGAGAQCWQRGLQGGLCEERPGLPGAGHSRFQPAPTDPPQGTAETPAKVVVPQGKSKKREKTPQREEEGTKKVRNSRGNTRSEEEEEEEKGEKEELHATSTEEQITDAAAHGEPHGSPEQMAGLNGDDFLELGLRNGRVVYSYNLGSGTATIISKPLDLTLNIHVIHLGRYLQKGWLKGPGWGGLCPANHGIALLAPGSQLPALTTPRHRQELPMITMTFQSLLIASSLTVILAISLSTQGCSLAAALPMCMSDWLRYNLGDKTVILQTFQKVDANGNTWHSLKAGRAGNEGYLDLDGINITQKASPGMNALDTHTDFFVGGVSSLNLVNSMAVENEPTSFTGCIREIVMNNRELKLTVTDPKGGANV